jgi:RNA polymerase sigma-70 factor (ECF subfamily)
MGPDDSHPVQSHRVRGTAVTASRKGELPAQARQHLGNELRALFGSLVSDTQPQRLLNLLAQLDTALAARQRADAEAFRQGLTEALPALRGFAISLTTNPTQADDLVQETLLKAWANQHRFMPGTNLTAWLMTIARNAFYTERRRRKREVEDADGAAAGQLIELPAQEHGMELKKVWQAMTELPVVQREALMLVGAQGMTYEAAAELIGCQVGTVKSRVSRARSSLADTLAYDRLTA